jgi:hypothetical protein
MVTAEELADSVAPEGVHSHVPQRPLFTDSSRPSLVEVAGLTMSTAQAVIGAVGGSLSDHLKPFAVVVVETGAAAKVEQSYFPEQQPGGTGPAALLWDEYTRMLSSLVAQQLAINAVGQDRRLRDDLAAQAHRRLPDRLDAEPTC